MKPIINYFRSSFEELGKISWPNRQQTIRLTVAVIIFSTAVAAFIGVVDYGFSELIKRVIVRS